MKSTLDRYLYTIWTLKEKYLCVRAVDVAHALGFSKASVSAALRQLREQGMIEAEKDGNLLLTAQGRERVGRLASRVSFFRDVLTDSGVEGNQALMDAIAFSWEMSEASFEALRSRLSVRP